MPNSDYFGMDMDGTRIISITTKSKPNTAIWSDCFGWDGNEDDKTLCAAAPELYEALCMAVKYLKGENMGGAMLKKLEAAIAKAEGNG